MKTVIFAAGKGVRMLPLTTDRPKPLVRVLDRPLLEYSFEALPDEVTEVIVVVGYLGDMVKEHFGSNWKGRAVSYVEQREQLGTWHALEVARGMLAGEDRFLVMMGDDMYSKDDIVKLIAHPRAILGSKVDLTEKRFGMITVDGSMRIQDIEETPEQRTSVLGNAAVYVLTPEFFSYELRMSPRGEYLITDGLRQFVHDYPVFAEIASFWIPIGYPEDISRAEEALRRRNPNT